MQGRKITRRAFVAALTVGAGIATTSAWAQTPQKPFGLPFAGEAGFGTWWVLQWYGNTRWAYRQKQALYGQGQGLHFGVDFAAACATPVVAIGAGTVAAVDGPYGSAPHNVLIRHANGYASLYGHLSHRASLTVGQQIARGQTIALSGRAFRYRL